MSFAGWLFRHTDEWRELQEELSLRDRGEAISRDVILRLNTERRDLQLEVSRVRTQLRAMQDQWQTDYSRLAALTNTLLQRAGLAVPCPVPAAAAQVVVCCEVCKKALPPGVPKIVGPHHADVQRVFGSMACVTKFQGGTFSA